MVAGRVQPRPKEEETEADAANQMVEKDPFNLSNDEYYLPKSSNISAIGGSRIQVKWWFCESVRGRGCIKLF